MATTTISRANCFEQYARLGWNVGSANLRWIPATETKAGYKLLQPHSKFDDTLPKTLRADASAFIVYTGEQSNVCVIDLDDLEKAEQRHLETLMVDCNAVQRTRKGRHSFYTWDERIRTTGKDASKVDTRGSGGCILCYPTVYWIPDVGVVEYTWERFPSDSEVIGACPEPVIAYLATLGLVKVQKEIDTTSTIDIDDALSVGSMTASIKTTGTSQGADLAAIIQLLDPTKRNGYDDWLRIGFICFNEGIGIEPWIEFSRSSPKYRAGECEAKWATFHKSNLTQATLWKWLKEDNPAAFAQYARTRSDVWALIGQNNHNDAAKLFYNMNPDKYMWCYATGWYALLPSNVWNNTLERPHGLLVDVMRTLQGLAVDARACLRSDDEQYAKKSAAIRTFYMQVGSAPFAEGVIKCLSAYYELADIHLAIDEQRHLLAFSDKVVDLRDGRARLIQPGDMIMTTTGYPYPSTSSSVDRGRLEAFLWSVWEDRDMIEYVLLTLAYSLSGTKHLEEFYSWNGIGRNGKGALADLVKATFGHYYYSMDPSVLTKPSEGKDRPQPALLECKSKRIVVVTEPEAEETSGRLQVDLIKRLTGNDGIDVRTLHQKTITHYVPSYTLVIQSNTIPTPSKPCAAFNSRHRVIPFPFKFVAEPAAAHHRLINPMLKTEILEWRDAFVLLLLEKRAGLVGLRSLARPVAVLECTAAYEDDNNPTKAWLTERCVLSGDDKDRIKAGILYGHYTDDNPVKPLSERRFSDMMALNNIVKKRVKGISFYCGISMKS